MFRYWYLKLLALGLAVLLWFVAWGLASDTAEIKAVPIKPVNLRPGLAYALNNYEIDLKIVAKKETLQNLKPEDFEATLDLKNREKGSYEQNIKLKSPQGVEVISLNPDSVDVRIENKIEKEVRLEGVVEGVPESGYLVGSIKLDPEKAKAIGPKSEIESLNKGTARIKLNGEKKSFSRELELEAINSQGKRVRSISFAPLEVKADVFIFSGSNNKAVGIKPKITGVPLAGYWVSGVSTIPSTIIINSDSTDLSPIESIETSIYDITGLKKNKEAAVSLVFSAGVSSVENIKEVKILIELSSIEMTRELLGSVGFKNTPEGRRAVRINSENIRVVISGPLSLTRTVTSSDVKIEIDLAGKELGDYRIELKVENIKTPEGIGVVSFLPNVVEVTID